MNLQSKFGYCIITQTLNIALFCKRDGITDRQMDRQTYGWTEDPITRCPWRTFQAGGIKLPYQLNMLKGFYKIGWLY